MPNIPTTAREYFLQFTAVNAATVIANLPNSQPMVFENEWLDFKSGKPQGADIPRIWSKAIGGFANNEGGVVIWGVIAKKDPSTGIDAAYALERVPNCDMLKSTLTEHARFATDPPLQGIEIVSIPEGNGGFVVCFVPEGSQKPYRSEKSERRFYLRIGDESKEPTVGLLRQLFYPKHTPRLRLEIRGKPFVYEIGLAGRPYDFKEGYELKVRNVGDWSVEDLAMAVECEECDLFDWTLEKYANASPRIEWLEPVKHLTTILHPQLAGVLNVVAAKQGTMDNRDWRFTVYAKDMQPVTTTISQSALAAALASEGLATLPL
jgi:hypothetical protein